MSPNRNSENARPENDVSSKIEGGSVKPRVIASPSKVAGGVARVVVLPDGSGRVESWEAGMGWVEGGASADELMPGACTPVTPELAARLRIPE